jgi:hypothetical protein
MLVQRLYEHSTKSLGWVKKEKKTQTNFVECLLWHLAKLTDSTADGALPRAVFMPSVRLSAKTLIVELFIVVIMAHGKVNFTECPINSTR